MRCFLIVISFICITRLDAQVEAVKLSVGGNYFWLESKTQAALFDEPTEVLYENGAYGYDIGYGLLYPINDRLLLGTDLNYSDRYRKQIDLVGIQQTVKYIGLHQKIYFKIGKIFKPYTGFGVNYLIAKRSSADIDFESTRSFYSNVDLSLQLGFAFKLTCFELFADFHYGLNPQRKILPLSLVGTEAEVNSKSRLLRVGLSYIIEGKDENKGKNKRKKKRRRKRR